jgi:hypothetical protein
MGKTVSLVDRDASDIRYRWWVGLWGNLDITDDVKAAVLQVLQRNVLAGLSGVDFRNALRGRRT